MFHMSREIYDKICIITDEEAIETAKVIGDNYLQERARGYSSPESFTHGTSAQRMRWLKRGLETGDMSVTTFNVSESEL